MTSFGTGCLAGSHLAPVQFLYGSRRDVIRDWFTEISSSPIGFYTPVGVTRHSGPAIEAAFAAYVMFLYASRRDVIRDQLHRMCPNPIGKGFLYASRRDVIQNDHDSNMYRYWGFLYASRRDVIRAWIRTATVLVW